MRKLSLLNKIIVPIFLIILLIVIYGKNEKTNKNDSTVLNTILNSENINNQIQQNRNFVVRNPDFTVAAEKTINTVVHVKNTAKSKGSNSLWDLFYGNSDDRTTVGTGFI